MKFLSILIIAFSTLIISKPVQSMSTPASEKMVDLIDELTEVDEDDFTCDYMEEILPIMSETHSELIEERNTLKMTTRDKNIHAIGANDLRKSYNLVVAMYNASCI